jgi:hypothetical protein
MRIQRKLQRIFEQNENLAHFLNYKAQAFYTQRRGPKKKRLCVNKKKNVSQRWGAAKKIPLCGLACL